LTLSGAFDGTGKTAITHDQHISPTHLKWRYRSPKEHFIVFQYN
jgi:hypothetical protein